MSTYGAFLEAILKELVVFLRMYTTIYTYDGQIVFKQRS